jgi:hypothetical protein
MHQRRWIHPVLALMLATSVALPGCVIVPDQSHYVGGVVMVAPPAARDEVTGVAPASEDVWFSGYWNWVGARYEWVAGHWAPGKPGYHWVAHHWVRQGDGWRLRTGHWARS